MRLILQRVSRAAVTVNGGERRETGPGLMILAGFTHTDHDAVCDFMANKAATLRIFEDEDENMNCSLLDVGGACLVVSNFTLYANSKKGRRPAFVDAAPPALSAPLYNRFVQALRGAHIEVATGEFGADMQVELVNDGPVTVILDSDEIMPVGKRQPQEPIKQQ